ncbi:hypothetical protein [Aquiflexum lacus]|uniref:hypothetical protein n=1 Tax=Aquiflexum lacus TaxID=2483805 RepID=UPI001893175C|nr:hypothetical protein [Aquiflexum lacus]
MRKFQFPLVAFFVGLLFLVSCNQEEDITPQVNIEEGQVSLSMVNLLSNSKPINARVLDYNPASPFCSPEAEIVVTNIPAEQRRITFIAKIVDSEGDLIGYKFRARNATNAAISDVEVRQGGNVIWSSPTLGAFTEVFFLTPSPIAGVSMFWDGGSVGTASTNENETVACESDPCEFVSFAHSAPSVFDVYFVPTGGGATIIEENVSSTSTLVLTIPLEEYTVWVTNFDDGSADPYNNLPDFANEIFMVGSSVIDYSAVKNGTVVVENPYAAVMVANNYQLDGVPELGGNPLLLASGDQYYLIYTKADPSLTLAITDIRGDAQDQILSAIDANQQYRFLLCLDSTLDITVESVFDDLPNDVIIDGN